MTANVLVHSALVHYLRYLNGQGLLVTRMLSNLGTAHFTTIEGLVERVSNMMG